jgi:hypothetical protein
MKGGLDFAFLGNAYFPERETRDLIALIADRRQRRCGGNVQIACEHPHEALRLALEASKRQRDPPAASVAVERPLGARDDSRPQSASQARARDQSC